MSIYNIMAFNAAHDQVMQNTKEAQAIDAKRVATQSAQEDLDIAKRTAESKIKIANNQGVLSDWATKQAMDSQKEQIKPHEDYFQAVLDAQDKAIHNAQQNIKQGTQVADHLLANDPDVQAHAQTLTGIMGSQGQTAEPSDSNQIGPSSQSPQMSMADGSNQDITPGVANSPSPATPGNADAQSTGASPTQIPSLPGMMQSQPTAPVAAAPQQSQQPQKPAPADDQSSISSPQNLMPIKDMLSKMDNRPYGDPSAQMRDSFIRNPNYMMEVAMGNKDAKPVMPVTADVLDRTNPLRLSPAQESMRQHIPNLLSQGYSRDEIIKNLPNDLGSVVKSIGEYKRPESELLNRATPAFRTGLTGLVSELYPNYSESSFKERNAFATDMGKTTPQSFGGQVVSLNTLAMHLGELNNKILVAQNKGVPVQNAFVNFVQNNLGHPEVNDFNAAKEIYANEMQRLLTGKAATQSGVGREAETLNQNSSTSQLQTVLKTNANMVIDKINSLRDKYKDTMGEDDGNKVIKPQAKRILNSLVGYDKFSSYDNGQEGDIQQKNNTQNAPVNSPTYSLQDLMAEKARRSRK